MYAPFLFRKSRHQVDASFLASASAFLRVSQSSLGIWPGALGQYRFPRNWVCPVRTIAWLHTLHVYSFRGAFSTGPSCLANWSWMRFRCRHSVVRLIHFGVVCGGMTALPTVAWPTMSSWSGISSGVFGSTGATVGRSLCEGSTSFANWYWGGNVLPWMRVFISSLRVLFLYLWSNVITEQMHEKKKRKWKSYKQDKRTYTDHFVSVVSLMLYRTKSVSSVNNWLLWRRPLFWL